MYSCSSVFALVHRLAVIPRRRRASYLRLRYCGFVSLFGFVLYFPIASAVAIIMSAAATLTRRTRTSCRRRRRLYVFIRIVYVVPTHILPYLCTYLPPRVLCLWVALFSSALILLFLTDAWSDLYLAIAVVSCVVLVVV